MIRAHRENAVLTFDVAGPATMMDSPAVHALANEEVATGARSLRIDLRDCTAMDSTFSGTLLALKRRLDEVHGDLRLVCPSDRVVELLRQMGLDDFYAIDVVDRLEGPWTSVDVAQPRVEALEQRVLDAHKELARVPGPAARDFRAVVEELRREQGQYVEGPNGKDRSATQPKASAAGPRSDRTAHVS